MNKKDLSHYIILFNVLSFGIEKRENISKQYRQSFHKLNSHDPKKLLLLDRVNSLLPRIKIHDQKRKELSMKINQLIMRVFWYFYGRKNIFMSIDYEIPHQVKRKININKKIYGGITQNNELKFYVGSGLSKKNFFLTYNYYYKGEYKLNYNWKQIESFDQFLKNNLNISINEFIRQFKIKQNNNLCTNDFFHYHVLDNIRYDMAVPAD